MDLKPGTPRTIDLTQLEKHLLSAPRELEWRYFKHETLKLFQAFWHWSSDCLSPLEQQALYPDLSTDLSEAQKSWCFALCLSFWTLKALPPTDVITVIEQSLPDFWHSLKPETLFLERDRREEWLRFWCQQCQLSIVGENAAESERRWYALSSQQRAQLYRRLRQRKRRRAQQRNRI